MKNRNVFFGQTIVSLSTGKEYRVDAVHGRSVVYYANGVRQVGDFADFKRKKFKKGNIVTLAVNDGTWGCGASNGEPCPITGIYGQVVVEEVKKLLGVTLTVLPMPKREECDTLQKYPENVPFVRVRRVDGRTIFGSHCDVYIDKHLLKHI